MKKMSEQLTNFSELFNQTFVENFQNISNISSLNETEYEMRPLEAFESWKQYLLTGLYTATSLIALVGNIVSIIVLIVGKRSSPELKKYLINLSISDIFMALFSIPFTYTDFMLGRWVLPSILCPFAQFITIFSLCLSVATLTAIALERYMAIMFPLRISSIKHRSFLVMLSIWSLAFFLALPQLFKTKTVPFRYGDNTYQKCREVASRVYSTNYSFIIFVVTFVLPLITLIFVYGSIGFKMFRKQIPGLNFHQNNNSFMNKLKAVKISAVVVMLFIICWLPIQLFNIVIWYDPFFLMEFFNFELGSYMALFFVCHWISSAHSFVNPIIYCFMSDNFREDLHSIIIHLLPGVCKTNNNQMNGKHRSSIQTTTETNV